MIPTTFVHKPEDVGSKLHRYIGRTS